MWILILRLSLFPFVLVIFVGIGVESVIVLGISLAGIVSPQHLAAEINKHLVHIGYPWSVYACRFVPECGAAGLTFSPCTRFIVGNAPSL